MRERGQREQTRSFGRYDARRHGLCLTDNNSKQLANNFLARTKQKQKNIAAKTPPRAPSRVRGARGDGQLYFYEAQYLQGWFIRRQKRQTVNSLELGCCCNGRAASVCLHLRRHRALAPHWWGPCCLHGPIGSTSENRNLTRRQDKVNIIYTRG